MPVKNDNKTDTEQEKLEIEQKKLEFEREKFDYTKIIDQQKLRSDRLTKRWSQFSIFIPVVILLIGFFLNSYAEQARWEKTRYEEMIKAQRQFVEKQLAEFYYPIQLRLNKDNAFFKTRREQKAKGNLEFVKMLDEKFMLPNHEEIIKIMDSHFDLIKNESDLEENLYPFIDAVKAYQKHVASYRLLIDTRDVRRPIQIGEPFPKQFFALIDQRTADLENLRDSLIITAGK